MMPIAGKLNRDALLFSLFLLSVFLLAVIQIEDTDAWTHLSFGKWIWEHRAIPPEEPFIHTSAPFPYNNWLFGFVFYIAYLIGNVYGVILLKAAIVTAAWHVMFRDSLRPHKNYVVSALVLTAFAVALRFRYVERPDLFLMVFLPFSVFALNAFVYENKRYLYALPLVHMLWANSHTSIPLMAVPFLAFLAGGAVQRYLGRAGLEFSGTPSPRQLATILAVFIASFAASLVSPYFFGQYTYSLAAVTSDWWKQEIVELLRPTWEIFKQPYIITSAFIISVSAAWIGSFRFAASPVPAGNDPLGKQSKRTFPSIIHLFLVLPFIYLSFTAIRFSFLLGIVAAPLITRNISGFLEGRPGATRLVNAKAFVAATAACMVIFTVFALRNAFPVGGRDASFGFGINKEIVPEGALSYMDRNGINGKVFNLFQWGGYITWRDFPKREPFIDGRGFLSGKPLEESVQARRNRYLLNELHQKHGFESILLNYPTDESKLSEFSYEIDHAFSHPDWALVYWDDLSLLYLRRGGPYDPVIRRDEYRFVRPGNMVSGAVALLQNPTFRVNFVKELKRNIEATGSVIAYSFLGFVYNETGLYRDAIDVFSRVRNTEFRNFLPVAYSGIAYAYGKLGSADRAVDYYRKSLALAEDASLYYRIGLVHLEQGDGERAVRYFEKAVQKNANLLSVYPVLINAYRGLGMSKKADDVSARYEEAKRFGEGETHFNAGVREYFAHNYEKAAVEFRKSIEVNPSNPVAYSNLGYIYFDIGMLDQAYEHQRKAVDIDPNYANAHYGLALIYKRRANPQMAKQHWEEYLKIEPAGYYSRKAKEEIQSLK